MLPIDRLKLYTAQIQSPLFGLPQELRDEIYKYYLLVEEGYHYNCDTGKISLANREPIDLRLMYTCRAIADEMKDVALGTNTVTFTTADIEDRKGFHGLHSRAGRLKTVIDGITQTRRRMLLYAAECVTPAMLQSTTARFGDGGRQLVEAYNAAVSGTRGPRYYDGLDLHDAWHVNSKIDPSIQYQSALRYLLQLASVDARFKNLALQAFDVVPDTELPLAVAAIPAAFLKALNWQPAPWEIPTEAQLASLEGHSTGLSRALDCIQLRSIRA